MAKKGDKRTEKDLREEYFDGPASDTMSFEEFLIKQGLSLIHISEPTRPY